MFQKKYEHDMNTKTQRFKLQHRSNDRDEDDVVFYLFLQKQKIALGRIPTPIWLTTLSTF